MMRYIQVGHMLTNDNIVSVKGRLNITTHVKWHALFNPSLNWNENPYTLHICFLDRLTLRMKPSALKIKVLNMNLNSYGKKIKQLTRFLIQKIMGSGTKKTYGLFPYFHLLLSRFVPHITFHIIVDWLVICIHCK